MQNLIIILLTLLVTVIASAAGGHGEGIPTTMITYQTINVAVIVVGLIWLLKKPVAEHFRVRRETYLLAANKAAETLKIAEKEMAEIEARLKKLETTAQDSIVRARAEAADLRKAIIKEAEETSQRIRSEAQITTMMEVTKAKDQLRAELVNKAIQQTREQLGSQVTGEDHERLQWRFVEQIQVVEK